MVTRPRLAVLAIAQDPELQNALRMQIGEKFGALRFVSSSKEARQVLRTFKPALIVWWIQKPTLEDISLAREIQHAGLDSPGVHYLHRMQDVAVLRNKLELLLG
jgi:hypothetical protein